MLVSHRHRFIYTKTVKTAGTSVEVYFEPYCVPEGTWQFAHSRPEQVTEAGIVGYRGSGRDKHNVTWWNHMPAADIRRQIGEEIWNSYFKFTVIRDPFDKAISAFHHFAEHEGPKGGFLNTVRRWFSGSEPDLRTRFKQWVRNGGLVDDRDKYLIDGKVCVDYFIRYEQLEDGIRHVCEKVGVPFRQDDIPKLKTGIRPGREVEGYYDKETAELVASQYRWEIEQFGYRPPV